MIWSTILGWLIGPIGRWVVMSVVGFGLLAWVRADARGPIEAQNQELRAIIKKRDETAEADRRLALQSHKEAKELQDELDKILSEAAQQSQRCRLSDADLDRLRKLSKAN